jgi:hypothetical protein
MNTRLLAGLAAAALIGVTAASNADARGAGGGPAAGWHGGGWHNSTGTWQGNGNWNQNRGSGWHGDGWHRGDWHRGDFRGHGFPRRAFFASAFFVGLPFAYWWGYPYWDPYYYYAPTVVYDGYPAAAAPEPTVRWYCPDTGYYPSVRNCERGWLRVLPGDSAPAP